ncbi:MAG: BREX-2 system adenine-specific DNA-methyltransferase PglX [Candidatus Eremiobacterota bacterium]
MDATEQKLHRVDAGSMLGDLRKLVKMLQDDLRERSEAVPDFRDRLRQAYDTARSAERTAASYEEWRGDYLTQVAVAWVLSSVFVRYLEDNHLVDTVWLAGPGERLERARDAHQLYFRAHPTETDRDFFHHVFHSVAELPGCGELFGPNNPLWLVTPSGDAARELLLFWQAVDPATGELRRVFGPSNASAGAVTDTRFLGDLYQDLSEEARRKYALLQTPEFVEEFILERTLDPAIETFGLETVRLLDPTCGSGHFLLGAFHRLFARWQRERRDENPRVLARRALDGVHGVDLNPFAVAIARFRLLVAALQAAGVTRLQGAPAFTLHVATGDSLLHGRRATEEQYLAYESQWMPDAFAVGEFQEANRLLSQPYHAVVGNPPYIVDRDKKHNEAVRKRYPVSCYRQFSLGVPFTERFFELASGPRPAGYVGMITANSFMKREFGKKLIEEVLPALDLTHVIDTSGAYIPGHGTPTVILLGRNRPPVGSPVRAVMGIRGEPSTPEDPAQGKVWRSVVELVDRAGSASEYVSVADVARETFGRHPWSIGGGGAAELKERIEGAAITTLQEMDADIGFAAISGEDNCFVLDSASCRRLRVVHCRRLVLGDETRDWQILDGDQLVWPNDSFGQRLHPDDIPDLLRYLWPYRTCLKERKAFGEPVETRGIPWWAVREVYAARFRTPLSIAFAFVATHNHFVLDRGGKVFNRSAPVIKLPPGSSEDDYLALLGVLNSSVACFWLKQVCHNKGLRGQGGGIVEEAWEQFIEVTAAAVGAFPVPRSDPRLLRLARELDRIGTELAGLLPSLAPAPASGPDGGPGTRGAPDSSPAGACGPDGGPDTRGAPDSPHAGACGPDGRPDTRGAPDSSPAGACGPDGRPGTHVTPGSSLAGASGPAGSPHAGPGTHGAAASALMAEPGAQPAGQGTHRALDLGPDGASGPAGSPHGGPGTHDTATPALVGAPGAQPAGQGTHRALGPAGSPQPGSGTRTAPDRAHLEALARRDRELRARAVALQEELDWLCCELYGLVEQAPLHPLESLPPLETHERPFAMVLARAAEAGDVDTTWFERHATRPVAQPPAHWPESYRAIVEERLRLIEENPAVNLVERPEFKRRWLREDLQDCIQRALRAWLLDRLETPAYWPAVELTSCARLADRARTDADFLQVAELYAGTGDFDLTALVTKLVTAEAVPYLPVLRYKPGGLEKRRVWEQTWDLQRREDAVGTSPSQAQVVGKIPVPPKYASADFLKSDYWRLRGKLDVPKERFVAYPLAERSEDATPVVGWAGWDHVQQAQALATYYLARKEQDGWTPDQLTPLLAGLAELVPWLLQWHNDRDVETGERLGDFFQGFLDEQARQLGLTVEKVRAWTPPATRGRGRKPRGSA